MTSKKAMLSLLAALLGVWLLAGCDLFPKRIVQPTQYASPYPAQKLWAVAPFRNESGTSIVDSAVFADHLTQQIQQAPGITIVPVNRVIAAMNALDMPAVTNLGEAMKLISALQVDGLLVGTITAWDPYEPPKIGAIMQLYARQIAGGGTALDTRQLTLASTDENLPGLTAYRQPVSTVSGHFDAANGAVLQRLTDYAHGRSPQDSAAGWRRYLLNMDLYSEFVSHELMRRLFATEWERLHAGMRPTTTESAKPTSENTTP